MNEVTIADRLDADDWVGDMGAKWLANLDRFESMIAPAGAALMAHAAFVSGERVIDVGCGAGGTTIEIAKAVGPAGEVLGIDISPQLIGEAVRRTQAADIGRVRFVTGDATTLQPDGAPFDRLFSRFGTMFFSDFPAAFRNLRGMIRPGGRADLAVWAPPAENAWVLGMQEIIGRHVTMPAPVPHAPGPFGLGDSDFLRALLEQAGFTAIDLTLWRGEQLVGGAGADPDTAAEFALNAMSLGRVLDDVPETKQKVRSELTALFAQHHARDAVRMSAAAWLVTAHA